MHRSAILSLLIIALNAVGIAQGLEYHRSEIFTTDPEPRRTEMQPDESILRPIKVRSQHGRALDALKAPLDKKRDAFISQTSKTAKDQKTASGHEPQIDTGFVIQAPSGIPNDNNIAISNDGWIVAVQNSNMAVYDSSGKRYDFMGLGLLASPAGSFPGTFDPHVRYDPVADRFICVFLDGSNNTTSDLLIAVSTTADPTDAWDAYRLPGNVHGDNTWSDYPFMGLSNDELFISVLLWQNGESGWDSEAHNELIWQVGLDSLYAGGSIQYQYHDSLRINGRQVWNTRPVSGGSGPYGPNFYLLGNRPVDQSNDSIFLIEISNTLASGSASMSVSILNSPIDYGIPPSSPQPNHTDKLRTNYCDIHSAFYEHGKIQFVGNTINATNMRPSIFHGIISDPAGTPSISANIYGSDSLDLNYPSLCYAGADAVDDHALINCLHVSSTTPAGISVFLSDGAGTFSDLHRVKAGIGSIVLNGDTLERWGDYTGMARRYNRPGSCWLAGGFANNGSQIAGNWAQKVRNTDLFTSIDPELKSEAGFSIFPNPVGERLSVRLEMPEESVLLIEWMDLKGVLVHSHISRPATAGLYTLDLRKPDLPAGLYMLRVQDEGGRKLVNGKVILD